MRGTPPARVFIIAASTLGTLLAAAGAAAGEAHGLDITFSAHEISREAGPPERLILRGEVRLECSEFRIEAAGIVLDTSSGDLYAEGPVRFWDTDGRFEVRCSRLRYNLRTHDGLAESVKATFHPVRPRGAKGRLFRGEVSCAIVEAERLRREGRSRFVAERASVTSCEFAVPHWRIRTRRVEIVPGEFLQLRGCALQLGRVPILWLPRLTMKLDPDAKPVKAVLRAGRSGRWGEHISASFQFPVGRPSKRQERCDVDMWGFSLGWRQTRGTEFGGELSWEGRNASGYAKIRSFSESDTTAESDLERAELSRQSSASKLEGSPLPLTCSQYLSLMRGEPVLDPATAASLPLERFSYAGRSRYVAEFFHRSELPGTWELETRLFSTSDRYVWQEYMEEDAKTGLPDTSYLELKRTLGGGIFAIHTGFGFGSFSTRTEYLPEVRWTIPTVPLGWGTILSADLACGWLRKQYDELLTDFLGAEDREAMRTRATVLVTRVFKLGPVVISPYLGTDQAFYSEGLHSSEPLARGATLYGVAASTKLFGRFDVGARPFRHIIETRAEFAGVWRPTADPAQAIGFDRWDDLMASKRVRFAIDQRLQTKLALPEGAVRSADVAGLLLAAEVFADEQERDALNAGRQWGPVRIAGFAGPGRSFRIYGAMEWDPNERSTLSSEAGLELGNSLHPTWNPPGGGAQWRAALSYVSTRTPGAEPSSELLLRLGLAPESRWRLELVSHCSLDGKADWAEQALLLARDFHDWELAFKLWHDPEEGDTGASVLLIPRGYPVNLPISSK